MAGGSGRYRQGGRLEKVNQQLYHPHFHPCRTFEPPVTERFKERQRIESIRIRLRNINTLQEHIQRIFTESLHSDLEIIIDCKVIRTNRCIIRTRSPSFYELLEPYFIFDSTLVRCALNAPGTFRLVENFVRLLYTNLDATQEEILLVELILSTSRIGELKGETIISNRVPPTNLWEGSNVGKNFERCQRDASVDISPAFSEMADSGLGTGSVSPRDNSVSETSGVDLEESQATVDFSTDEDSNKITFRDEDGERRNKVATSEQHVNVFNQNNTSNHAHKSSEISSAKHSTDDITSSDATCSFVRVEPQYAGNLRELDSSGSSEENAQKLHDRAEEIARYENRVLDDAFYESESESDENDRTNSFVPTESFEFIDPVNMSPLTSDPEKALQKYDNFNKQDDEKLDPNPEARSMTMEELRHELSHSNDLPIKKSSSSTSSYYFIDASSLNDEGELTVSDSLRERGFGNRIPSYIPSSIDCPSNGSGNPQIDEHPRLSGSRRLSNLQTGCEKVAEFEKEIKITERLEPLTELRRVKRFDSTSEDKSENEKEKNAEKETLVVEIKEADSGESARASPCPDNSKGVINTSKPNRCEEHTGSETSHKDPVDQRNETKIAGSVISEAVIADEPRRPSLIRRNTFELDPDDEKISMLRQEYERRQGSLVFQNSIQQYSGHRVDGDSCFDPTIAPDVPVADEIWIKPVDASLDQQRQPIVLTAVAACAGQQNQDCKNTNIVSNAFEADKNVEQLGEKSVSLSSEPISDVSVISERGNECPEVIEVGRRSKCIETTPIVSGGAAATDYSKPTDSPIVRRKTESTPIVSGGSVLMEEPEVKVKPVRMCSSMTSWVVDMSNPVKEDNNRFTGKDKVQETMSQSLSNVECIQKTLRKSKAPEKLGSLGFFVNLNDADVSKEPIPVPKKPKAKTENGEENGNGKNYCEFFIDISENKGEPAQPKDDATLNGRNSGQSSTRGSDKRNIFSMFIDLGDSKNSAIKNNGHSGKPEPRDKSIGDSGALVLGTSLTGLERTAPIDRLKANNGNSDENGSSSDRDQSISDKRDSMEQNKQSIFMFIESDSPVVRRRTLSSSRPAFKRHSWNVDKGTVANGNGNGNGHVAKELVYRKEHKRAHSLSVDRADLRKNQTKTSNSSHSLSEVARADTLNGLNSKRLLERDGSRNMDTSSEDVFEYDNRDTPPNSHIEIFNEELRASVKQHEYKELTSTEIAENFDGETKANEEEYSEISVWDKTGTESTEGPDHTRKSETFDISSGSGPSPGSDHQDSELSEMLNGDDPKTANRSHVVAPVGYKVFETQKSLNEKIKKIECELTNHDGETDKSHGSHPKNVNTSKTGEKALVQDFSGNKSAPSNAFSASFVRLSDLDKTPVRFHASDVIKPKEDRITYRMSSSIPETSWVESKLVMSRSTGPLRNVPRKFTSAMTTSLPSKQKSSLDDLGVEGDGEGVISESDLSSMQSSMGRSGADASTEETETSSLVGAKPYNRLGEDLLRMFLEEINPDVTIDVSGRRIRAHKCILSSRCQYFAAILSGGWVESAGNVIALQGYSYNSVHFALCHIYSGESNIPDTISIVELATLADMLCLEGLKEVISYTLKVKYCHLFHKPCQICAVGVLECMPLAAAYGLDEVYRKSLRWITRHFVRIWPCKAFATLPRELMDKCYHQHIVHMSTDNVLQTMMDCDKLLATLPNVRWAEPVFRLVSNLLETAVKFLSDNFSGLLGNEKFHSLGREFSWNISRIEDNILAAADRLPPEQACKSYARLHKMLITAQSEELCSERKWGQLFVEFLKKIHSHVEKCLVREAPRAARSTTWLKMDLELRRRIQELACLVILPHEISKRPSRHSNFMKEPRATTSRTSASRSLDLRKVKMAISEHNDKTLKQPTVAPQVKKIPISKPKTDPLDRRMHQEKLIASDTVSRPRSWPNKIEVKPRYLEPRNKSVTKEMIPQGPPDKMVQQRRKNLISSSDSSRTSSPAMKRAVDKKTFAKIKLPIKKDAKALSTDSLAESSVDKTNSRKDLTSKSCGVTRPESPLLKQKDTETGLSVDSLAEAKKMSAVKKKATKMDTSMSTDSLMAETVGTPKSTASSKLSPTLTNHGVGRGQGLDRGKKMSPPTQHRSPLTITRRAPRSVECSTAASRNRALPVTPYHGSPSLRRNLLDAAKTPDIPGKPLQTITSRTTAKQANPQLSGASIVRRERKGTLSNQPSVESPKKLSPKSSGTTRVNRSIAGNKKISKGSDDKIKTTCHNSGAVKQPTVGSRSGTFLKDEPTILKKSDIKSSQANL